MKIELFNRFFYNSENIRLLALKKLMLDFLYKLEDYPKQNQINTEQNTASAIPFINPKLSLYFQNKMSNGESILAEIKENYPENVPNLDQRFIEIYIDYFEHEKPDFSILLDEFLINNAELLIQCGIMKLLFEKVPNSFNHIYHTLISGGKSAFFQFDQESGFYIITRYSSDKSFSLIISQILQVTIANISDYSIFYPPIKSIFNFEPDVSYPNLDCTILVTNLFETREKQVILSTLKALRNGFVVSTQSQTFLGPVLMKYFNDFIVDSDLAIETVYTFSAGIAGISGIPQFDKKEIINISESQINTDNDFLQRIGIKLIIALIEFQRNEINKKMEGKILDIFENTHILPTVFEIAQIGSYKLKISALQLIDLCVYYCLPNELNIFFENGLFKILSDTFENEQADSSAEREIILICINILRNSLKKGASIQVGNDNFNEMIKLFKYLKTLICNEDQQIANFAQNVYIKLLVYYGDFEEEEQ